MDARSNESWTECHVHDLRLHVRERAFQMSSLCGAFSDTLCYVVQGSSSAHRTSTLALASICQLLLLELNERRNSHLDG